MASPRYQVFVSSTFTDLQEERRLITEQLLKQRCIPAGMELFGASGLPPWDVITRALADTDYMVLILAGRYGSPPQGGGLSYTEREYDYAVAHGIPVIAFLHSNVDSLRVTQVDHGEDAERRAAFRAKVQDSGLHTVAFYENGRELALQVVQAVNQAIVNEPRPGWFRGEADPAPGQQALDDPSSTQAVTSPALSVSPGERSSSSPQAGRGAIENGDDVRLAAIRPEGVIAIERALEAAATAVADLPAVSGEAPVEVSNLEGEHQARLNAVLIAGARLVMLAAATARWGNSETDRLLIALIKEHGRSPLRSGYVSLIDLQVSPAVLLFHAAGLGARAGARDDMVGELLSANVLLREWQHNEDVPAVSLLSANKLFGTSVWPSKELFLYLRETLLGDPSWRRANFDDAWQRWQLLSGSAIEGYRETYGVGGEGMPYLRIERDDERGKRTSIGREVMRELTAARDSHPLFAGDLFGGSSEAFIDAVQRFDRRYSEWGDQKDWAALPSVGGVIGGWMPTAAHYPGERDEL